MAKSKNANFRIGERKSKFDKTWQVRKNNKPSMKYMRFDIVIPKAKLRPYVRRKIKKKVGIEKNITCYVARHTFSTVMKRSGASIEFIQEALGHTNIKTTDNYLDIFEKEVKKEFLNRLVSFKEQTLVGS